MQDQAVGNTHTHTHPPPPPTHTHKIAKCGGNGKGCSPAQKHVCPNTANSTSDTRHGFTRVQRWLPETKGSNVQPWKHCIQAYLSEELLLQLKSPALVSPGSCCQVANVSTLQDHLHMSNTSKSSAHVKHLKIICTCQTRLHCTRCAQDATHLHMYFAFNAESLWTRSVLVVVRPCPCWENISSRQVQQVHK